MNNNNLDAMLLQDMAISDVFLKNTFKTRKISLSLSVS